MESSPDLSSNLEEDITRVVLNRNRHFQNRKNNCCHKTWEALGKVDWLKSLWFEWKPRGFIACGQMLLSDYAWPKEKQERRTVYHSRRVCTHFHLCHASLSSTPDRRCSTYWEPCIRCHSHHHNQKSLLWSPVGKGCRLTQGMMEPVMYVKPVAPQEVWDLTHL